MGESATFVKNFVEWATLNGFQKFYTPQSVELPEGVTINEFGWLAAPTVSELIIPLETILPNENRNIYWISQKITSNSPSLIRASLEANETFREETNDFDPNEWFAVDGFAVSADKEETWFSLAPYVMNPGQSIRLRVFPTSGNSGDFLFRFAAFDIPNH
jgi:hypothetical protein